jgi:hypothetical protein
MNQIKKHAIGYNTVSSVDGIINARGVKSKPNDIRISGYTHEVGEGEKSPDNPYVLKSLDSGNVNLYSEDKLTTHKVNSATGAIRTGIKLSTPKSSYYCVRWDENTGTRGISYKLVNQTTGIIDGYKMFYVNSFVKVPHGYDIIFYDTGGVGTQKYAFTERTNLMILDSPIMPNEYITDEHSIVLSNNNTTIRVPVPITLKSVDGVSDRIVKKDGEYYIEQNIKSIITDDKTDLGMREQKNNYTKFNINIENGRAISSNKIVCNKLIVKSVNKDDFGLEYIRSSLKLYPNLLVAYMSTSRFTTNSTATANEISAYLKDNPIRILYQVENPYYLKLSDYAQTLLNSFTLQNDNEISVEGYPDIKISGYIQK